MKHYYEAPDANVIALTVEEELLGEPGNEPGTGNTSVPFGD